MIDRCPLTLTIISDIYSSKGQYTQAVANLKEAIEISKKQMVPIDLAMSLNTLGYIYNSLGYYEKAISCFNEALNLNRKLNAPGRISTNLNNIGYIYFSMGQYEKSLSYHYEALKIRKKIGDPELQHLSEGSIGFNYLAIKDYENAKQFFRMARTIGYSGLVEFYLETNRSSEAIYLLNKITPDWYTSVKDLIWYYNAYGLALGLDQEFKRASEKLLKAVNLTEEMRHQVKRKMDFLGSGFWGGRIRAYRGLVITLSERVIRGEKKDKDFSSYGKDLPSAAFYFAELMKARTLLEAMAESALYYTQEGLPPEMGRKEESLLNQLSEIENRWQEYYKRGEDVFKVLYVQRKEKLKRELDTLIAEIRKESRLYAALNYPQPILAEDLPLKDNEVLLEYAIGNKASYVFRVKKGGVNKVIKIDKGKEDIEALVNAFILPLQSKYTKEEFSLSDGKELYGLLLAEALEDISIDKEIIIVPGGILGLLPFEALVTKEGKDYKDSQYVGDIRKIRYSQSASVLALNRLLEPSDAERPLFALGNPYYSERDPRYVAYKEGKPEAVLLANLEKAAHTESATRREWCNF